MDFMKTPIGLWIDHRRAVVVGVAGVGEDMRELVASGKFPLTLRKRFT